MKRRLVLSLLGGVVLFLWGFISWALLPWHMMVANKFTDEAAVSQVLKENAPRQGMYYLPFSEKDHGPDQVGAFANVLPQGTDMNMGRQMAISVITQIIAAFLVLSLMNTATGLTYMGKVGYFAFVGLIVGFVALVPDWVWFGFTASYTLVTMLDSIICWTLAGLAVAGFTEAKQA